MYDFDWLDYLVLAKRLANETDEAAQRCAVSRAYYTAFHKARLLLESEGVRIPKEAAHQAVWEGIRLTSSGSTTRNRIEINSTGDRLRKMRVEADYFDNIQSLDKFAEKAIHLAEKVIRLVDAECK